MLQGRSHSLDEANAAEAAKAEQNGDAAAVHDDGSPSPVKAQRTSRSGGALLEQEMQVLRKRVTELEQDQQRMTEENKRLKVMQRGNRSELKDKCEEMQRDIDKFMAKIGTLEAQRDQLTKTVDELKQRHSTASTKDEKVDELKMDNGWPVHTRAATFTFQRSCRPRCDRSARI